MPTLELAIFATIGLVATFAAAMVVLARKAVYSALFLVLNLFCVAVLYLSLSAEFVAAVQILVYAGAIVVLFLFVITLLNPREEESPSRLKGQAPLAIALGLALLVELALALTGTWAPSGIAASAPPPLPAGDNVRAVGQLMFTDYLLPFEITSILLLIALLGATVLAKGRSRGRRAGS